MQNKDLISIIIPVHNGQEYIRSCVESVLNQALNVANEYDKEIIIVNSGSTDNTAEICLTLQEQHEDIKVHNIVDQGVSNSRNVGLTNATGDYITFLDVDDRLFPGTLPLLYRIAKQSEADIVGCGFAMWYNEEDYQRLFSELQVKELEVIPTVTYRGIEYIDKGILTNDTRCWSKLYRRESIQNVRFKQGLTIGEDMLFLLEAVSKVNKITITEWKGYAYYQNVRGATLRPFHPTYMDQLVCWQKARILVNEIHPELEYRVIAKIMIAVMLIIGKIAVLPELDREQYQSEIDRCSQSLKEAKKIREAVKLLDKGYRIKISLFNFSPYLYIKLYHLWKR